MYNIEHAIAEINQITGTLTMKNVGNSSKTPNKDLQNKTNNSYTILGNCWKCDEFGPSAKECQNNTVTANQDQTMVTTFKNTQNDPTNLYTIELIRYPNVISLTRPPIVTQEITTDFQLSQEAWNKLTLIMPRGTRS